MAMRANAPATSAGSLSWPAAPVHGQGQSQAAANTQESALFYRILAAELANDLPLPGVDNAAWDARATAAAGSSWTAWASLTWPVAERLAGALPAQPADPLGFTSGAVTDTHPEHGVSGSGASTPPSAGLPAWVQQLAASAAARYGVPAGLVMSVIAQESGGDPNAVSSAGAVGLMQLLPSTAAALGVADVRDPTANVDAGTRYLAQLLQQFGGDTALALAAYNAGPGAVQQARGIPPYAETQHYVQAVLTRWQAEQAAPAATDGGWAR
ncbi:MAG: lytic transglycosylase domain-containing protein [Alicyclobacillus sp.]|nr:lytic transglycosylase domain-containing protein [Alicyclobacillus sp.]